MHYWILTGNWLDIVLFLVICLLWAIGGWQLVSHIFHLKQRENLIAGIAAGFLLFIVASNLLAQILTLTLAYWVSAALIFVSGLISIFLSKNGNRIRITDLKSWPHIVTLAGITLVFTLILRGLAIFDDYFHLPMISVMATGDIPPHFYLDPSLHMPYHYGLQVFAASMVRLGGFFPWSAWDISRAAVFALTAMLAWLWLRRLTGRRLPAYLGTGLLIFGGATRYLLLLIPLPLLSRMGANLHMDIAGLAAGGSLVTNLTNRWPMDGSGPFPFPFAFASGIFEPLNMQIGASGAMWEMTILLLLLLWKPGKFSIAKSVLMGLLLASLALSAEHVYAAIFMGMLLVFIISGLRNSIRHMPFQLRGFLPWGVPLVISVLLAIFQGGYITGGFMSLLSKLTGQAYPMVTTDFQGFIFRWPPAMPSGHFGPLSLGDPGQVIIMLAEMGPALILLIFAAVRWLPDTRKINHLPQALLIGAILSVIFPVFFRYGLDFDITRLVGGALWLSYALTFPLIWLWLQKAHHSYHLLAGVGYGVAIFAGLVMLSVELVAIPVPQTTYYLKYSEENFARSYWNQLEPGAQILDSYPERAILLFGRASFAAKDVYQRAPEWKALVANPDPLSVSSEGYAYVYMDEEWWQDLSPNLQASYSQPCVNLLAQLELAGGRFRRLYKVADCHP